MIKYCSRIKESAFDGGEIFDRCCVGQISESLRIAKSNYDKFYLKGNQMRISLIDFAMSKCIIYSKNIYFLMNYQ